MTDSTFTLTHANVVIPNGVLYDGVVRIEDGLISFIGIWKQLTLFQQKAWNNDAVDAQKGWVLPGFIDLHIHGGYGASFMDANAECYDKITKFHMEHGTTAMLATSVTQSHEVLDYVMSAIDCYMKLGMDYAQLIGVHLEGPFINPKYKGAQNEIYMVDPQIDWFEDWYVRFPGLMKQVSLAPERDNAMAAIQWLRAHQVNVAAAHTAATYDQVIAAANVGLNQATHTFNAMTPIHHREPGVVGAILTDDRIIAEIISDGIHVHPACIKILIRTKTLNKLVIVTDAISAAGMPDGQYDFGGLTVTKKDAACRLANDGSLAGSTLTMIQAVKNMIQFTELPLYEISRLASLNPARQIGIDSFTGSIEVGKQADLVWTDADLNIQRVWIKGKTHM